MAETDLNFIFRALDQASQVVSGLAAKMGQLRSSVDQVNQQQIAMTQVSGQALSGMKSLGAGIDRVGGKLQNFGQSMALGFTVPLIASSVVLDQFDRNAVKLQAGEAFERVTRQFNVGSDQLLEALDKAAGGTVSKFDLMQAASRSMTLGVGRDVESMSELMMIARDRARIFGLSTAEAFEYLTIGIGRQSRLILDNLGILVRIESATKIYAKSVGKAVDDLTDQEKRQAFLNAVLEQTRATMYDAALATRNASEEYLYQRAKIRDLGVEVMQNFLPKITQVLAAFNSLPNSAKIASLSILGISLVLGPLASAFGALLKRFGQTLTALPNIVMYLRAL